MWAAVTLWLKSFLLIACSDSMPDRVKITAPRLKCTRQNSSIGGTSGTARRSRARKRRNTGP